MIGASLTACRYFHTALPLWVSVLPSWGHGQKGFPIYFPFFYTELILLLLVSSLSKKKVGPPRCIMCGLHQLDIRPPSLILWRGHPQSAPRHPRIRSPRGGGLGVGVHLTRQHSHAMVPGPVREEESGAEEGYLEWFFGIG